MMRRLVAAVVLVGAAVVLVVIAWPQLFGEQQRQYVAQVLAFRALAAAVALLTAVVLLVVALVSRRFRRFGAALAAVLLVFVVIEGIILASRGFGAGGEASDAESLPDAVTVMAWNTEGDTPSADDVARIALDAEADVVSLPETSATLAGAIAAAMAAAGRPMQVTHLANGEGTDVTTALLTSTDLGEYALDRSRGDTSRLPTVVAVPIDGSGPTIVAAHPIAPIPRYLEAWRRDLAWLADLCGSGNMIMAGDFNSTTDHWADLSAADDYGLGRCRDAATDAGSGAVGTWPTVLPALLASTIDHVTATPEWEVEETYVVTDADDLGSDHRPIVATLVPAAG